MLTEVLELLRPSSRGLYVDGTVGEGGHAIGLLEASAPDGRLIGLDRDPYALDVAKQRLAGFGNRVTLVHGDFRDLPSILEDLKAPHPDGVLLDLGVSSLQLATPDRGFSFQEDGPLDMRMDPTSGLTAAEVLSRMSEAEIRRLLIRFGEGHRADFIARAIVRERARRPIDTTGQLARIIENAVPPRYRRGKIHPATRVFMALRVTVNEELHSLDTAIENATLLLVPRGRICILTYHSLEHRTVRRSLRRLEKACRCPPDVPECRCSGRQEAKIVTRRALRPTPQEVAENPRCRSAQLWCAERV